MKVSQEFAKSFAQEWINGWNNHDLDMIISHYAENINYFSPFIELMKINDQGYLDNRSDVKIYFEKALKQYPDLKFTLHEVLCGTNSIIIYYQSVNEKKCAECMDFNGEGKISSVKIHYN